MADLLVKLYDLPQPENTLNTLRARDISVRNARPYEKHETLTWIKNTFSRSWSSECEVAFGQLPVTCFIAVQKGQLIGFAGYECTCRNYFGPIGVHPDKRGMGVGKALLLSALYAMAAMGYAYVIVGGVGNEAADEDIINGFYAKTANAFTIPGSNPGIYTDRFR